MTTTSIPGEADALEAFTRRLKAAIALLALDIPELKPHRPASWIAKHLTEMGYTVTRPGVTRWLNGECFPTYSFGPPLALLLRVNAPWLFFGDGEMRPAAHDPVLDWLRKFHDFSPTEKAMAKSGLAAAVANWDSLMGGQSDPESPPSPKGKRTGGRATTRAAHGK